MKRAGLLLMLIILFSLANGQEIRTMAEESGFVYSNDYTATMRLCRALDSLSPMVHLGLFGQSAGGYDLPYLVMDKNGLTEPQDIRRAGRVIIMIQAGIHPGEPEGNDAGFMLIRDMVTGRKWSEALDSVSIVFIPVLNADGLNRLSPYNRINQNGPKLMGWRTNARNLNLNRDYLKADSPEIRAWLRLFNRYEPDFFIDCHTTDGADYQYVLTYALPLEFQVSADHYKWLINSFLPYVKKHMYEHDMPVFQYISFRRWADPTSGLVTQAFGPRYSTGYVSVRGRPSLLIETHSLKDFRTRLWPTYYMLGYSLEVIAHTATEVGRINRQADIQTGKIAGKTMTLRYKLIGDTVHLKFLGKKYEIRQSTLTGGKYAVYTDRDTVYEMPVWGRYEPAVKITVPHAYIIPVEWTEVIDRLKAHGIEFFTLNRPLRDTFTTYRFRNVRFSSFPYEGRQRVVSFDIEKIRMPRTYGKGSVVVPVSDSKARVIVQLLEPQASSSLLYWGFFNPVFEQKEYAEIRVMEPMARQMLNNDQSLAKEWEKWKKVHPEASQWEQLNWFYMHTPYWDKYKDVYPVAMIYSPQRLREIVKNYCTEKQ